MHSPVFGPLFRNIEDEANETELVFLITPRFISDVDPAAAPKLGPGQMTTPPSSRELMIDGYLEVPRCAEDCAINDSGTRLQNQFSNQGFQSNGFQTMPASYPQMGRSAKPNLSPYPSSRQVQQAMAKAPASNIMPASFEQAAQRAGTKKNLLQRIGIGAPNDSVRPQATGNGFAWPTDQQN
jgi:pilus assembly protein CpaC